MVVLLVSILVLGALALALALVVWLRASRARGLELAEQVDVVNDDAFGAMRSHTRHPHCI